MTTRKGWKRIRDKDRPEFPYHYANQALGAIVFRSAVAHCWLVHRSPGGVQSGEFTTAETAMAAVEKSA
jgi:hypothetical protein